MAYERVNGAWPETVPPLTGPEAVSAAKRLYRFAMKKPFSRLNGKWTITSGRRRNRVWRWTVNPDRGWKDLVHHLSHLCHRRLRPAADPHGPQHAFLEREMIEYVVQSGWLDGKLRRTEKPKPGADIRAIRRQRVLERMEAWERKRKRAETALKKLRRQQSYYERQLAA